MTTANSDRLDLFILTGFLGSGKTTLLNRLLADPALADTAVIVNEFGEIALDHLLVEAASGDVILLDSGCLCCAAGETFADTLINLWVARERGDVPRFSRVVVETSGLAEPLPLAATVMKNRLVAERFRMAGVITVVDGVFGGQTLAQHHEAREQLALADTVVLSKGDHPAARLAETRAAVLARDATARLIEPLAGRVDAAALLDGAAWSEHGILPDLHPHDLHHGSTPLQRGLTLPQPVLWAALAAFIERLKQGGEPLLRCKGLLAVQGEAGPVLVQGVRNLVEHVRLTDWPDPDRSSRMVFIFEAPPIDFEGLVAPLTEPA